MSPVLIAVIVVLALVAIALMFLLAGSAGYRMHQTRVLADNSRSASKLDATHVLVLALARDAQPGLDNALRMLKQLRTKRLPNLRLMVLENGSFDNTLETLRREHEWVTVVDHVASPSSHDSTRRGLGVGRIGRMASLRGVLREEARKKINTDVILMLDIDLDLTMSLDAVPNALKVLVSHPEASVVTSVGLCSTFGYPLGGIFRDAFAWVQNKQTEKLSTFKRRIRMNSKGYRGRRDVESVISNFGGMALYRGTDFFSPNAAYTVKLNEHGKVECEHTSFHRSLPGNVLIDHAWRHSSML